MFVSCQLLSVLSPSGDVGLPWDWPKALRFILVAFTMERMGARPGSVEQQLTIDL